MISSNAREADIPNAARKAREARYFLGQMHQFDDNPNLDDERFDHNLSAFVSAGRSVGYAMQKQDKATYDGFWPRFEAELTGYERQLLRFFNDERVNAVKLGFTSRVKSLEWKPSLHAGTAGLAPQTWAHDDSAVQLITRHVFEFSGADVLVADLCASYLPVIERAAAVFTTAGVTPRP
jgi:hypothetical protein